MNSQTEDRSLELVRAAAERGVAEAQALYGQMLLDGKLVERKPSLALHFFECAARGGHVMAMNMVGRCLDQGWGIAPSQRLAANWFRKAAEHGLDWGMYNLATLLILGDGGVVQDRHEALHWLRKAVELGHAKSMNLLGGFYEDGWELKQDLAMAREHYRNAAVGGDFRGQFNYARLVAEDGDVVGAIHWLKKVPETATPAFLAKMSLFLSQSQIASLREFAATLSDKVSA